ncbi:hypothetical protein DIPPA_03889 [Diplonema papillatum]|nr:hypothetical protein DIPPA_03889 [Diplonema papillatum]
MAVVLVASAAAAAFAFRFRVDTQTGADAAWAFVTDKDGNETAAAAPFAPGSNTTSTFSVDLPYQAADVRSISFNSSSNWDIRGLEVEGTAGFEPWQALFAGDVGASGVVSAVSAPGEMAVVLVASAAAAAFAFRFRVDTQTGADAAWAFVTDKDGNETAAAAPFTPGSNTTSSFSVDLPYQAADVRSISFNSSSNWDIRGLEVEGTAGFEPWQALFAGDVGASGVVSPGGGLPLFFNPARPPVVLSVLTGDVYHGNSNARSAVKLTDVYGDRCQFTLNEEVVELTAGDRTLGFTWCADWLGGDQVESVVFEAGVGVSPRGDFWFVEDLRIYRFRSAAWCHLYRDGDSRVHNASLKFGSSGGFDRWPTAGWAAYHTIVITIGPGPADAAPQAALQVYARFQGEIDGFEVVSDSGVTRALRPATPGATYEAAAKGVGFEEAGVEVAGGPDAVTVASVFHAASQLDYFEGRLTQLLSFDAGGGGGGGAPPFPEVPRAVLDPARVAGPSAAAFRAAEVSRNEVSVRFEVAEPAPGTAFCAAAVFDDGASFTLGALFSPAGAGVFRHVRARAAPQAATAVRSVRVHGCLAGSAAGFRTVSVHAGGSGLEYTPYVTGAAGSEAGEVRERNATVFSRPPETAAPPSLAPPPPASGSPVAPKPRAESGELMEGTGAADVSRVVDKSVAAAAVASVFGSAASGERAVRFLLLTTGCYTGALRRRPMPFALDPVGLSYEHGLPAAALVGNCILMVSSAIAALLVLTVGQRCRAGAGRVLHTSGYDLHGTLRLPALVLLVGRMLFASSVLAAVRLFFHPPHVSLVLIAVMVCIIGALAPLGLARTLRVSIPVETRFVVDEAPRGCLSDRGVWLAIGLGEWVNASTETHWVARYGAMFIEYERAAAWWVSFELVFDFMLAVVAAMETDSFAACGHVKLTSGILSLLRLLCLLYVRPHVRGLGFGIDVLSSFLETCGMFLVASGMYMKQNDDVWLEDAATFTLAAAAVVWSAGVVAALGAEAYVFCTGRRRRLQNAYLQKQQESFELEGAHCLAEPAVVPLDCSTASDAFDKSYSVYSGTLASRSRSFSRSPELYATTPLTPHTPDHRFKHRNSLPVPPALRSLHPAAV